MQFQSSPAYITNSSIVVSGSLTIAGGSVSISGTASVSLSAISSSITMPVSGTVAISGTPSVNISGTPNVTIGNSPTVYVTQAAGAALNVGGTVTVGNTSIAVENASGGSLTVAGTINIGNTPAVTVSSGTVAISSGSVDANITNASIAVTGTVSIGNTPAVTVNSGSVDIGTIANGNIIDVVNSPNTVIGIGSDQAVLYSSTTINISGTIPSGGSITTAIATILNSAIPPIASVPSPAHALAWFTNLQLTASVLPVSWAPQLIDSNGHIYLQPGGQAYNNGGFYSNQGTFTENVNPVAYINDGNDLALQLVVEGSSAATFTLTGTIIVIAYTSSIPPRSALDSVAYLYGGVLNQVNTVTAVQELPTSGNLGLTIADMLAPADSEYTAFPSITAATWTALATLNNTSGTILQSLSWACTNSIAGRLTFRIGSSGTGFVSTYGQGLTNQQWRGRMYVPANEPLQVYCDDAITALVFSIAWATL